MTIPVYLIDAMIQTGCSAAQIADIVRADSLHFQEKELAKRENARQRKKRERANKLSNEINEPVTHVTRDACDIAGQSVTPPTPFPSPDKKEKSPHTPLKEKTNPNPIPIPESKLSVSGETVTKKGRHDYPEDFLSFWENWKTVQGGGGKFEAFGEWKKLSVPDRILAIDSVFQFWGKWRNDNPEASPLHGVRYLRKHRWDEIEGQINGASLFPQGYFNTMTDEEAKARDKALYDSLPRRPTGDTVQ